MPTTKPSCLLPGVPAQCPSSPEEHRRHRHLLRFLLHRFTPYEKRFGLSVMEPWRRGWDSHHNTPLRTRNLLILRCAQDAKNAQKASRRYTAGTRTCAPFSRLRSCTPADSKIVPSRPDSAQSDSVLTESDAFPPSSFVRAFTHPIGAHLALSNPDDFPTELSLLAERACLRSLCHQEWCWTAPFRLGFSRIRS